MINSNRLWTRLHQLAQIGQHPDGGMSRFSFTSEERLAKNLTIEYMHQAGLTVREDEVGNLIGRKEGKHANGPVVLIGSHLDSVPNGGIFDGPLGVLAGIEVLQSMQEQGIEPDLPVEVIAFTDEEGARFQYGMIGSRALAGTIQAADLERSDQDGITITQAMRESGFAPERIGEAAREKGSIRAYVELHIEQGKVLENAGLSVGVVSGIAGPLWLQFNLKGEAGHAGATPMNNRKDALLAASKIIQALDQEVRKHPNAVGTVGQLSVQPGGINVIPGHVEFSVDLREVDEPTRDTIEQRMLELSEQICREQGIEWEVRTLQRVAPAPCSAEIRDAIELSCQTVGLGTRTLPSGAGHDGMQLKAICPIGMIFIRSRNGISHNPEEWSSQEDCADGANVLYHTVLQLANQTKEV